MTVTNVGPATDRLCALIETVSDSDLDRPTPCTEYTVGDLLDHIRGVTVAHVRPSVRAKTRLEATPSRRLFRWLRMPHRWIKPWACWDRTRLGPRRGDHIGQASFDHGRDERELMTEPIALDPQQLDSQKVVLLRTRKRDGSWVDTPVNIAVRGDRAYFRTPGKASKNKRLRNFPEVQIRPCTWSGKPTPGPTMTAHTRLLSGEESDAAGQLIDQKYPVLQHRLVRLAHKIMRTPTLHYELTP